MLALVELSEMSSQGKEDKDDENKGKDGVVNSEEGRKVLSRLNSSESAEGNACAATPTQSGCAVELPC